ncbi:MAG: hypothetical protein RMM06_06690 [Armatimonadota bacterium]|nr:hypothetical protein [Armatimonadota bacterium]
MFVALAMMATLALAALTALSGCGGGGVTPPPSDGGVIPPPSDGQPPVPTVRGKVVIEQKQGVSGIRVVLLPGGSSALTNTNGEFVIPIRGENPTRLTIDLSSRQGEFHRYFTHGSQTFEIGCNLGPTLPAAQNNIVNVGEIIVYPQENLPPPPGDEVCP